MASHTIRPSKRQRLNHGNEFKTPDIRGAFELHDLLRFRQTTGPEVKTGVNQFKDFLTALQTTEDQKEKAILLKVLKQYCEDQSSSNQNDIDFPDLLSTWSFAAQTNTDPILSAVPAALAQFFRTISSELEFRDFGLSLCNTLLKREQLQLFEKAFDAPKFKEFVISPCLRLLSEIVSFDGGASATTVFARRNVLLRRLEALLDTVPSNQQENDRRKPSVRRNAQRLLLALLKYLDTESKVELIMHGKAIYSCLRRLPSDGEDIITELMESFRRYVLNTDSSPQTRLRFLSSGNLSLIAALYDYEPEALEQKTANDDRLSVRELIHQFLLHVCTTTQGALLPQSGWYPLGFSAENSTVSEKDAIDLGLDSPWYFDEYEKTIPVKNTNLSMFIQNLRPHRDILQAELLTKTFEVAPELVADYFAKKPQLATTSKDESIWRGQFAFIFSVVNLPVLRNCGRHDDTPATPPPMSVVVESILPRPMDRKVLLHCLHSNNGTIVISAARLITKVLTKLSEVQQDLQTFSASGEIWTQASARLTELVISRAPTYHDFVTALQTMPKDQTEVRIALLESVATYHKVLPALTAGSKFDVGPLLTGIIDQLLEGNIGDADEEEDTYSQAIHLVEIGSLSTTIRWWHKAESDQLCPFVSLLRASAVSNRQNLSSAVRQIVFEVLQESGVVRCGDMVAKAMVSAFHGHKDGTENVASPLSVFLYAENCMIRTSKQPVKYLDQLESVQQKTGDGSPLSLLACCIVDQWPFMVKSSDAVTVKYITQWVARLFGWFKSAGENATVLDHFRKELAEQGDRQSQLAVLEAFKFEDEQSNRVLIPEDASAHKLAEPPVIGVARPSLHPSVELSSLFPTFTSSLFSLKSLTNWTNPDFESELTGNIANSRLAGLIRSLSSSSEETRLQALETLRTIMHSLSTSTYAEKDQVYLLLGELVETANQHTLTAYSKTLSDGDITFSYSKRSSKRAKDPALPNFTTSLAILLLSIITDPANKMYSKANRFLMRGPAWTPVTRIIPYWIDQILLREPEYDEPHMWELEVNILLDVLIEGLRTEQDLDLYRKGGVFERLGSLYFANALTTNMGMKKKILYVTRNAIEVQDGANTMITRMGLRSWFTIMQAREGTESKMGVIIDALKGRLEEKCGKEYIERWEKDRLVYREAKIMR